MKLTLKKLLFATLIVILLDISYIWLRERFGITEWFSPKTLKFWTKEAALLIAWGLYFAEKRKKSDENPAE